MRRSMLLAAAAAAVLVAVSANAAGAAPLVKPDGLTTSNVAEAVQYRFHCRRWRHECARRWGLGGWRYRRCLTIRGCF